MRTGSERDANGMRTRGGGEVEEYQLGSKIQLTDIIKKDCISNWTADVTGLHSDSYRDQRIQEMG